MSLVTHRNFQILITLAILMFVSSCKKDKNNQGQGYIPNVAVSLYLNPFTEGLLIPGDHKAYPYEGYHGVFVYCVDPNIGSYMAFEMACPYDYQKEGAIVEFDPASYQLIDSVCMSRFNVLDGAPVGGPASVPLKQYFVEFEPATNLIHIFNGN